MSRGPQGAPDSHQGTSAWLGWSRGQNGLSEICAKALRCWGLQWWRWRQLHWERSGERQVGRTAPKAVQHLQMGGYGIDGGIQSLWKRGWLRGIHVLLRIMGTGSSSRILGKLRPRRSHCEDTVALPQWKEFYWWLRVASIMSRWREREREREKK